MPLLVSLRPRAVAAAVAAAVCTAAPLHAQTGQSAPAAAETPPVKAKAEPEKIQKVEIKGTAYDPRRDDTASKIIVSSEELLRYGDTSVSDVLKRLPGITVGGGGRGGNDIRMRGLGSGYTQILLNGERAPAGFSIDTLAPDSIERIEIVRAASAEFSTQSIAGTINIVLKKAIKAAQRELKLGGGKSADASNPYANLQWSDKLDTLSYSLTANTWRYRYDRQTPTEETLTTPDGRVVQVRRSSQHDRGDPHGVNLSARLNWTLKDGDTITWQSYANTQDSAYDGVEAIATPLGNAPLYTDRTIHQDARNTFGRSDVNWVGKLAGGAKLDVKVGLNSQRSRTLWEEQGYRAAVLGRDATIHSRTRERGITTQGKYSTPLVPGHALSMGWDAGSAHREESRVERDADLPGARPDNSDEGYQASIRRLALYAQDEWDVTPRWSMYLGVRWEGIDTTSEGNTFDTVRTKTSVWSPLAQTLYKIPDSRDQLRLALTRTYKAPSANSLIPRRFTATNNSQTEPDRRGNPDLQPELATGIDASYEHYWAESALLSAAVSMRRISGYTRQGLFLDTNGRWVAAPVNDGSAVSRSIELEAKLPLSAVMKDAPGIDLRASVSRNWSRVEAVPGPDNRLGQQTPLSATLGIDYKTRDGKLTTGGSFAFKNGGAVRIDVNQTGYQSVQRDLDLYALWKFTPQYQLRLAVTNVLGQDYVYGSAYRDDSGTRHRTGTYRGYPTARATLEIRF
ncbi:TonB-dependent receptor plug domain-containing protein [Pseudoduganella armeniaca]|uniref:Outer membrane receptor protein n=1 Tax=Pseudoduganella armeniaca TaxID=2072590 RepID=A0A2R4CA63_9BURK|nr:TonB-dependent receptor [Pseudoduganella armeniaca]AVR96529.1 outer membrane receptor protein [Pseudoduganella armeniaca]